MLLKKANYAGDLQELRTLERQHGSAHRQQIANSIRGVEGEQSTAHYLDREFKQDDELGILHDVRIGVAGDYAQTDHLVIDRINATAWVIETKNLDGTLSWNTHGDWTVEYPQRSIAIESPVAQARRHCATLLLWFRQHGIQITDVRPVVLVGARTAIARGTHETDVPVMKADVFPTWLKTQRIEATRTRQLGGARHIVGLTAEELHRIGEALTAAHVPPAQGNWRIRLGLPGQGRAMPQQTPRRGGVRTMRRRNNSVLEEMLFAATRSQVGALSIGGFGVLLASPLPHAILDALMPSSRTDNIYVGMTTSGFMGAGYFLLPAISMIGLLLCLVAIISMLAQGRNSAYRTHLKSTRDNAIGAGALAFLTLCSAVTNPPHLFPGNKEASEVAAVVQGRSPGSTAPGQPILDTTRPQIAIGTAFPANGTAQWGYEQPIGGDLQRLDIWDVTGSPQDKIVNVRQGMVADMPNIGLHTRPYVTVYVRAGQHVSLMLPVNQAYRVSAMSGDAWKGPEALFGPTAVTVNFGLVTILHGQPQVVAMGAPDQTASIVPNDRF